MPLEAAATAAVANGGDSEKGGKEIMPLPRTAPPPPLLLKKQPSLPGKPTAAAALQTVGSILGARSESGSTVDLLKVTGSFETDHHSNVKSNAAGAAAATATTTNTTNNTNSPRLRANTAPPSFVPTMQLQQPQQQDLLPPSVAVAALLPTTTTAATAAATTTTVETIVKEPAAAAPKAPAAVIAVVEGEEEDEELKLAMAMALAIQSNPHMTPAEIHQLLGQTPHQIVVVPTTKSVSANRPTSPPSKALIPGRLTHLLHTVIMSENMPSSAAAAAAASGSSTTNTTTTGGGGFTALRDRARGMLANATTTATNANPTTTTPVAAAAAAESAASIVAPPPLAKSLELVAAAAAKPRPPPPPPQTAAALFAPSAIGNSAATAVAAAAAAAAVPAAAATTTTAVALAAATAAATRVTAAGNKLMLDANGTKPAGAAAAAAAEETWTANATATTTTTTNNNNNKPTVVIAAAPQPPMVQTTQTQKQANTKQQQQQPSPAVPAVPPPSSLLVSSSPFSNNGGGLGFGGNINKQASSSSSSRASVRLTGIAWKRRGGMGKYSNTAWERRRISLQGTKLLYYLHDEEHSTDEDHNRSMPDSMDGDEALSGGGGGEHMHTKRSSGTWFETAGLNWASAAAFHNDGDNAAPRGFIDLAKEKATVHAAFGHSGAPSPFALSIKVRGETKWKLCFDRHSTEMEWLSAISDVVVQCSVDSYNASLLEAADPANHSDFALFQPPFTKDGAATRDAPGSGHAHRLWMLEGYRVSSHDFLMEFSDDDDEVVLDKSRRPTAEMVQESAAMVSETETTSLMYNSDEAISEELDHGAAQQAAKGEASKTWVIPEENLRRVVVLVNIALLYARASSTTIAGFWLMVVFTNLGIFLCLAKHPSWESLLEFVRAVPNLQKQQQVQKVSTSVKVTTTKTTSLPLDAEVLDLAVRAAKKRPRYIPDAGSTSVRLNEPTDPPKNGKGEMFAGWRTVPGDILAVRSHGYSATKKKVPSPGELYECVAVDVFESPHRYPDMAKRVKLPKVDFEDDGPKTWRSPDIFIISIALPTDSPKVMSSSDGGGYTITMYYRMKPETRDILRRVTADGYDASTEDIDDRQKSKVNAVRLLEEWVRRAPTDHKFQARFKIVPNAHNLKEIGMPAYISNYNGKPFLIKRPGVTGFLHVHPDLSCVEFDVSLHPFPYLAKQGICFMKERYFNKVLVSFGFVIEGRADDELPECLIGLVQLCYPDPQYAIQAADFFSGTAPRSF